MFILCNYCLSSLKLNVTFILQRQPQIMEKGQKYNDDDVTFIMYTKYVFQNKITY